VISHRPKSLKYSISKHSDYRHCCGRHGHSLWPSWFVAVIAVAVMVVAVMVKACGRHGLWPSWSWFVAVIGVAVMVNFVAVMVCGRHCRTPFKVGGVVWCLGSLCSVIQ